MIDFDTRDIDGNFLNFPESTKYIAVRPNRCAPLPAYEQIGSTLRECGDSHVLQTAPPESGITIDDCNAKCVADGTCEWFMLDTSNGQCLRRRAGCEET